MYLEGIIGVFGWDWVQCLFVGCVVFFVDGEVDGVGDVVFFGVVEMGGRGQLKKYGGFWMRCMLYIYLCIRCCLLLWVVIGFGVFMVRFGCFYFVFVIVVNNRGEKRQSMVVRVGGVMNYNYIFIKRFYWGLQIFYCWFIFFLLIIYKGSIWGV